MTTIILAENVIDSEVGVRAKTSVVGDDTAYSTNQTNQPGGMQQQPESAQKKDEKAAAPNTVAPARIAKAAAPDEDSAMPLIKTGQSMMPDMKFGWKPEVKCSNPPIPLYFDFV